MSRKSKCYFSCCFMCILSFYFHLESYVQVQSVSLRVRFYYKSRGHRRRRLASHPPRVTIFPSSLADIVLFFISRSINSTFVNVKRLGNNTRHCSINQSPFESHLNNRAKGVQRTNIMYSNVKSTIDTYLWTKTYPYITVRHVEFDRHVQNKNRVKHGVHQSRVGDGLAALTCPILPSCVYKPPILCCPKCFIFRSHFCTSKKLLVYSEHTHIPWVLSVYVWVLSGYVFDAGDTGRYTTDRKYRCQVCWYSGAPLGGISLFFHPSVSVVCSACFVTAG